jgi:hypothetical protein
MVFQQLVYTAEGVSDAAAAAAAALEQVLGLQHDLELLGPGTRMATVAAGSLQALRAGVMPSCETVLQSSRDQIELVGQQQQLQQQQPVA